MLDTHLAALWPRMQNMFMESTGLAIIAIHGRLQVMGNWYEEGTYHIGRYRNSLVKCLYELWLELVFLLDMTQPAIPTIAYSKVLQ